MLPAESAGSAADPVLHEGPSSLLLIDDIRAVRPPVAVVSFFTVDSLLTLQIADSKHAARSRAKLRLEARLQVWFWAGWWHIGDRSIGG
jgi:hypothetical protein